MELNNVYLRSQQTKYKNDDDDIQDEMIKKGVILFLEQLRKGFSLGNPLKNDLDYHFAVTIPTHWDKGIREGLISEMFIRAGLINKEDHRDRLLIFTRLESRFRFLQSLKHEDSRMNTPIIYGRCYTMYAIKIIDNKIIVSLDLFSAQYPPMAAFDNYFVPHSIKSIYFDIDIGLKKGFGKYLIVNVNCCLL